MLITQGYSAGDKPVLQGYNPFGRTIIWNSTVNAIPALTAPTILVAYTGDVRSAVVTITCDVNGAFIRYETNGRYAVPNCNSPVYSGPITVKQNCVFHACWYFNGLKSHTAHAAVHLKL
jgi:Fn3 associated